MPGCSIAKRLREPIARSTDTRAGPSWTSRAPAAYLPLIADEGESTTGEGTSGKGASSQNGGRVANLDSELDPDMTGMGPILPATRKAPAAEAGAGTGEVAEGNPPAPSAPVQEGQNQGHPSARSAPPRGLKSAV